MAEIIVYHNTHAPHLVARRIGEHVPFMSPACRDCTFERVYSYEGETYLEAVWVDNQNIDAERNVARVAGRDLRSLSIGDVVEIDGHVYAVETIGWLQVDSWEPRT